MQFAGFVFSLATPDDVVLSFADEFSVHDADSIAPLVILCCAPAVQFSKKSTTNVPSHLPQKVLQIDSGRSHEVVLDSGSRGFDDTCALRDTSNSSSHSTTEFCCDGLYNAMMNLKDYFTQCDEVMQDESTSSPEAMILAWNDGHVHLVSSKLVNAIRYLHRVAQFGVRRGSVRSVRSRAGHGPLDTELFKRRKRCDRLVRFSSILVSYIMAGLLVSDFGFSCCLPDCLSAFA